MGEQAKLMTAHKPLRVMARCGKYNIHTSMKSNKYRQVSLREREGEREGEGELGI